MEGAEDQASELKVTIVNLSKLQASFDKLEVAQTNLRKEKEQLEATHLKTCNVPKVLTSEYKELKKEHNKVDIALKTMRKDVKENNSRHERALKNKDKTIEKIFLLLK